MDKRALLLGSLVLFLAVAFGAFGAHGLKTYVEPEALAQWKTAVEYQFYHGLGLLLLAGLASSLPVASMRLVRLSFTFGILLFCGSIYLLATRDVTGLQGLAPVLGPLTPLGGLCFMVGWATLFITAWRRADDR
ncbi:MAG TPA: DUF423 domain-containing protein [Flavobacteriales bacterium]|jgi:uncharacterized membrane protein YgdD (TMEM256/DUF423 family)|nr:DUF423 domain-containing protein [Flavobacteriales bacterium]